LNTNAATTSDTSFGSTRTAKPVEGGPSRKRRADLRFFDTLQSTHGHGWLEREDFWSKRDGTTVRDV
jgi:hypothetical protein